MEKKNLLNLTGIAMLFAVLTMITCQAGESSTTLMQLRSLGSDSSGDLKLQWFIESSGLKPNGHIASMVVELSNDSKTPYALKISSLSPRIRRDGVVFPAIDFWVGQFSIVHLMPSERRDNSLLDQVEMTGMNKHEIESILQKASRDCRIVGTVSVLAPGEKLVARSTMKIQETDKIDIGVFSLTEWYKTEKDLGKAKIWTGSLYLMITGKAAHSIANDQNDQKFSSKDADSIDEKGK